MADCMFKLAIATFLVVLLLSIEAREQHHLHCSRWKSACDYYERYNCSNGSSSLNSTNSTNSTNYQEATTESNSTQSCVDKLELQPSCCNLAISADSTVPSGVYKVDGFLGTFTHTLAYCDLHTANGGWTVIQRRLINSTVSFNRTWQEYVDGFGELESDFWYGLSKMQWLTNQKETYELQIDVTTSNGKKLSENYSEFSLKGRLYTLSLGEHKGETNILNQFKGCSFTTYDANNSDSVQLNCAQLDRVGFLGGWWYKENCLGDQGVNANGKYGAPENNRLVITSSEMKIRPIGCSRSINSNQGSS